MLNKLSVIKVGKIASTGSDERSFSIHRVATLLNSGRPFGSGKAGVSLTLRMSDCISSNAVKSS